MEYSKIISVSGMSGLFELVGSKKDGAILKGLEDKVTKFVSSRVHNFSHLESIEVYTVRDNINLVELLQAVEASGKALPGEKDGAAIKRFFEEVYPDIDFERVYASDMKKMVKWYSILKANNVELKLSEQEPEEEKAEEKEVVHEAPEKGVIKTKAEKVTVEEKAEEKEVVNEAPEKAVIETKAEKVTVEEKAEVMEPLEEEEKLVTEHAAGEKEAAADSDENANKEAPKKRVPRKKKTEE